MTMQDIDPSAVTFLRDLPQERPPQKSWLYALTHPGQPRREGSSATDEAVAALVESIEVPLLTFPLRRNAWRKAIVAAACEERYRRAHPFEETANGLTHALATVLAALAFYALIRHAAFVAAGFPATAASRAISFGQTCALSVYGISLVLLYGFSASFHLSRSSGPRNFFKVCDQSFIFVFIAATCTPLTMPALHFWWGAALLVLVWLAALFGCGLELFFVERGRVLPVIWHIAIGWAVLLAVLPILAQFPAGGVWWVVGGGICYTVGVLFYLWQALPFHHAIWHGLVALGSACHFAAIYWYAIPAYGA